MVLISVLLFAHDGPLYLSPSILFIFYCCMVNGHYGLFLQVEFCLSLIVPPSLQLLFMMVYSNECLWRWCLLMETSIETLLRYNRFLILFLVCTMRVGSTNTILIYLSIYHVIWYITIEFWLLSYGSIAQALAFSGNIIIIEFAFLDLWLREICC